MSPDINPIEHVWDFIGRKINQRNPKCQNIIYHPERRDYDVAKIGFKTGAGKT
jgi:transposase